MKLFSAIANLFANIRHHVDVWRMAWKEQSGKPGVNLAQHEREFLPALLEIQESPPSPVGRVVGILIISVFVVAVVWAVFGKIDIVAVAQGKIIPSDYSKIIQPLEAGVIKNILVRDGQAVKKGDLLVELDPTSAGADEDRINQERTASMIEALRLRALLEGKSDFVAPEVSDAELVALQQRLLRDELQAMHSRTDQLKLAIEQRKSAGHAIRANITKLETLVPILEKRAQKFKELLEKNYVTELQYLEVEEQRVTKTQELVAERHRLNQETAALAEASQNYNAAVAEFKKKWLADLSAAETRVASLEKEVTKAETRTRQQTLVAPIDGVVQQMAVHTIGGVVTPAQQLMVIAPNESLLEVEAYVENKDIGFVEPGQVAEIKIEAFPFTTYGTIEGKVLHLSQDAVPVENLGLMYSAKLTMAKSTVEVDNGKTVKLSPGMNVTVEIKTGSRRLIEYILSPLIKGMRETARER